MILNVLLTEQTPSLATNETIVLVVSLIVIGVIAVAMIRSMSDD